MKKLSFTDVYNRLEKDELNPYNFYNIDLSIEQSLANDHYKEYPDDTIDNPQILKKVFLDIELFLEHKVGSSIAETVLAGKKLVNAITVYFSSEETYYSCLVPPKGFNLTEKEIEEYIITESKKPVSIGINSKTKEEEFDTYLEDHQKIIVKLFNSGIDMILWVWEKIKKNDPAVLSGWNSDTFDYPYLYHYLLNHFGDHDIVSDKMSNFGEVELDEGRDRAGNPVVWLRFPEYNIVDLLYCYKARDDGGLNLGKKLQSYALNNVAKVELGLTKFEYKLEGLTLDQLYEKDPLNFLLYNTWDTALCYKIDKKTGMINLYNTQRRKMNTPFNMALRGASPLFDTYIYTHLSKEDKFIRWGINSETSFGLSKADIDNILKPKTIKKIKWCVESITARDVSKIINRFPGA